MVGLTELDGNHDATVHGLIEVIGPVGGQDDQTIVPGGDSGRCTPSNVDLFSSDTKLAFLIRKNIKYCTCLQ